MELFMLWEERHHRHRRALLHSWADNYSWSGRWETLGTGLRSERTTLARRPSRGDRGVMMCSCEG